MRGRSISILPKNKHQNLRVFRPSLRNVNPNNILYPDVLINVLSWKRLLLVFFPTMFKIAKRALGQI